MKKVNLILFVSIFLAASLNSCKSKKLVEEKPSESGAIDQSSPKAVGEAVRKAISGNSSDLEALLPDAAFARILSPKETKDMTDEKIKSDMLDGLRNRLIANVENVQKDIRNKGIDSKSLKVVEIVEEPSTDPPLVPRVLSVKIENDNWRASVPVTYVKPKAKFRIIAA